MMVGWYFRGRTGAVSWLALWNLEFLEQPSGIQRLFRPQVLESTLQAAVTALLFMHRILFMHSRSNSLLTQLLRTFQIKLHS